MSSFSSTSTPKAALNHIIPQPVLIPGIAPSQVQDLALGLVEPHEVHTGSLLELIQVPLDGIPSFWRVSCTTQLGVICKLAEGALDAPVCVIDEGIEQHWSQYGPLTDTTRHRSPSGHGAVDHCCLDVTIQPIPHPLNSPPIKSLSLQFREKDVVGDRVEGLMEVQIDDIQASSVIESQKRGSTVSLLFSRAAMDRTHQLDLATATGSGSFLSRSHTPAYVFSPHFVHVLHPSPRGSKILQKSTHLVRELDLNRLLPPEKISLAPELPIVDLMAPGPPASNEDRWPHPITSHCTAVRFGSWSGCNASCDGIHVSVCRVTAASAHASADLLAASARSDTCLPAASAHTITSLPVASAHTVTSLPLQRASPGPRCQGQKPPESTFVPKTEGKTRLFRIKAGLGTYCREGVSWEGRMTKLRRGQGQMQRQEAVGGAAVLGRAGEDSTGEGLDERLTICFRRSRLSSLPGSCRSSPPERQPRAAGGERRCCGLRFQKVKRFDKGPRGRNV
ncbi:hypothetical protein QYF61_023563 [Mycteria americana]|uniref:Uncharacterized protein n=1 Tax=Mycteria americana TaxID=33587 RepID=A0AAN7NR03_MYCAM|nr:hypothetical protein QYF61_023563 [Mycteria americana]